MSAKKKLQLTEHMQCNLFFAKANLVEWQEIFFEVKVCIAIRRKAQFLKF
jgi:hypothetical protein